ncbi:hypothetical protein, partial [Salmonella enterica]|uniref:hypothetical protein n=1 Tax=Salmonella enterica TaxID=28901 RepID=UPI00352382E5
QRKGVGRTDEAIAFGRIKALHELDVMGVLIGGRPTYGGVVDRGTEDGPRRVGRRVSDQRTHQMRA